MSIDNKVENQGENELWKGLYSLRVNTLNGLDDRYLSLPIEMRSTVLLFLDKAIRRLELGEYSAENLADIEVAKSLRIGSRTANHYFAEVKDKQKIYDITKAMESPDIAQARKIVGRKSKAAVAEVISNEMGVGEPSALRCIDRMLSGRKTSGYMAAKVAHWFLERGYTVKVNG